MHGIFMAHELGCGQSGCMEEWPAPAFMLYLLSSGNVYVCAVIVISFIRASYRYTHNTTILICMYNVNMLIFLQARTAVN